MTGCTVSGNSASGDGGGIYNYNYNRVVIGNTIVAGNTASSGPDVHGSVADEGSNLIGDGGGSTGFTAPGDQVDTAASPIDPLLGPLQDNGGPTRTMALLPGSPAIDKRRAALIPRGVTTDQRGAPRISCSAVGIGAFESRGLTIVVASRDGQSARVSTGFLNPLAVTVTSPYGDTVQGGVVAFTAPGGGPDATFAGGASSVAATIDPTGRAAVAVTANTVAGAYAVMADASGATFAAGLSLTNTLGPAARIKAIAQTAQAATVGYAFGVPLEVQVTDAFGNPVPGASVLYAAPTAGAGGVFDGGEAITIDAIGVVAPTFIANTKAGSYQVTAGVGGAGPVIFDLTNRPDVARTLVLTAPAGAIKGVPFSFTVTAVDPYGNVATGYGGAVRFSSGDPRAVLPASYSFRATDNGVHTFSATLNTAGSETLMVTDTAVLSLTSTDTMTVSSGVGPPPPAPPRGPSPVIEAITSGKSGCEHSCHTNCA
jgi:hypothetical protein